VLTRVATLGVLLPLLAGCTSEDPVVRDDRMRWASTALPSERAGKLDAFDSGPLTAENAFRGSLTFDRVPAGDYDVYLACRGGWRIDVVITGERGVELGSVTLLCGEVTAVEIAPFSTGVTVTATAPNENTDWAALVLPTAEEEVPGDAAQPEPALQEAA
jgi:hypothetical protein